MKHLRAPLYPRLTRTVLGVVSFLVLWFVLATIVRADVLPSPVTVIPRFISLSGGELGLHFLASAARVLAAILLALLTAVPLGLVLGAVPVVNRFVSPLVDLIHPVPKIVFLPVIYVLAGVSDISKIVLISLILFFQILVVVRDAALGLSKDLVLSARSIGAGRLGLLFFIYVPASVPSVLTSVRVSVGTAIAVLFIAEQSLTRYGLGYFIVVRSYQVLRYVDMYAGILAISLLGLLLYALINALERRFAAHLHIEAGQS